MIENFNAVYIPNSVQTHIALKRTYSSWFLKSLAPMGDK